MASPYPVVYISPEHLALLEAIGAADPVNDTTATVAQNLQSTVRSLKRMFPPLLALGLIEVPGKGNKMEYVLSNAGSDMMVSASRRVVTEQGLMAPQHATKAEVVRAEQPVLTDHDMLVDLGISLPPVVATPSEEEAQNDG